MDEPEPAIVHAAQLLATRLERLSADSYWAHKASGLRGSLLRSLEDWEAQHANQPNLENFLERLDQLNQLGFAILTRAARDVFSAREK